MCVMTRFQLLGVVKLSDIPWKTSSCDVWLQSTSFCVVYGRNAVPARCLQTLRYITKCQVSIISELVGADGWASTAGAAPKSFSCCEANL